MLLLYVTTERNTLVRCGPRRSVGLAASFTCSLGFCVQYLFLGCCGQGEARAPVAMICSRCAVVREREKRRHVVCMQV